MPNNMIHILSRLQLIFSGYDVSHVSGNVYSLSIEWEQKGKVMSVKMPDHTFSTEMHIIAGEQGQLSLLVVTIIVNHQHFFGKYGQLPVSDHQQEAG